MPAGATGLARLLSPVVRPQETGASLETRKTRESVLFTVTPAPCPMSTSSSASHVPAAAASESEPSDASLPAPYQPSGGNSDEVTAEAVESPYDVLEIVAVPR